MRRLAEFLEVDLDEDLLSKICDMCKFNKMKKDSKPIMERHLKENYEFFRKGLCYHYFKTTAYRVKYSIHFLSLSNPARCMMLVRCEVQCEGKCKGKSAPVPFTVNMFQVTCTCQYWF